MKKKLICFVALFLVIVLGASMFSGCMFFQFEDYNPYDDDDGYVEPDYDFTVTCTQEETTITLGSVGNYGATANLVYLKPYQYLKGESVTGIAVEKNVTPTFVAEYECGTEATITINRYTEEDYTNANYYDTVYCKFYVVSDGGDILAGPIYATEIDPIYDHDEVVKVKGIKGVATGGGTFNQVVDLGCEFVQLGVMTTGLVVPLEIVDEKTLEVTPIEYQEFRDSDDNLLYIQGPDGTPQYVEEYWHNGHKYYFRIQGWGGQPGLDWVDAEVSAYTRAGIKTTVLLLMGMDTNQYVQPYFLTYVEARYKPAGYYAVNTANRYGAEYWSAFTQFIANRYSQEDVAEEATYGAVESWVLSNEIDQCAQWNCMRDYDKYYRLSTEDYMTEFERMMRITNQSFKTIYSRNIALAPITHWWNGNGGGSDYNPKDIVDTLCLKTRREGNYNWGLAIHPYGANLAVPNFWSNDVNSSFGINGTFETKQITWTNLEVLQLYLEQELKMFNGQVRDVYVTEGGVSSSNSTAGPMVGSDKYEQAAGVAYSYYKATQLPCIKALNYYKLIDSPEEGAHFGLMTTSWAEKPSYTVYKYIDTKDTWSYTSNSLTYISWSILENGTLVPHGYGVTPGFDWFDAMLIMPSDFDWGEHWDESKIIVR